MYMYQEGFLNQRELTSATIEIFLHRTVYDDILINIFSVTSLPLSFSPLQDLH